MSLSRVGGSSVAATSVTIPAHVAGDIIVIWAFRDGSTTPPTVPTAAGTVPAFTTIDGPTGANSCSAVCAWAVAAGTTDTSGTWTNATGISVEVWRGAAASPIGGHAQNGSSVSSGGNLAMPAITQSDPSGSAVILAFAGWQTVTAWSAAPSGYTQQSQVATECEALTKDSTTSDGAFNVSGTASGAGGTRRQQVELIAGLGNRVTQQVTEVLGFGTTTGRITQQVTETVLNVPTLGNRLTQQVVEVLRSLVITVRGAGIAGTSSLTATVNAKRGLLVAIAGTSSLAATVVTQKVGAAVVAGTSSLTAAINRIRSRTATIAGTSSLSATISTGGTVKTFTATIAGTSSLRAVTPYILHSSGEITLQGDDAVQTTYLALGSAQIFLNADAPTLPSGYQPSSGVIKLAAGSATQPSLIQPTAGVITLRADTPNLFTLYRPVSGVIALRGDAPTMIPYQTPTGKILLKGDAPLLQPTAGIAARIILAGGPPNVFPLQIGSSGVIRLKADDAITAHVGYIMNQSGIIRLRSDVPVVTPLNEPPPPPPPPPGTGLAVSGTE